MNQQLAADLLEVSNVYELILKMAIVVCVAFVVWVMHR